MADALRHEAGRICEQRAMVRQVVQQLQGALGRKSGQSLGEAQRVKTLKQPALLSDPVQPVPRSFSHHFKLLFQNTFSTV